MHFILSTAFNSVCKLFIGIVSFSIHFTHTLQQKVIHKYISEVENSEEAS